ncbi:MAG: zinc ABC transporter substrate-binding protein [Dehalococcoidia bacterium]
MTAVLAVVVLLAGLAATACDQKETAGKIGVAVTILPQAEFVESVGGDKVEVTVMVPSGASPHTYEPTPSQMTALSDALMYAKVGSGVEFELTWLDNLVAQNEDMLVVDCSQGVTLQAMAAGDEGEPAGAMDPHIWMSPQNAQIMVRNIAEGLIQVDPDNRDYYERNRDDYIEELAQLDSEISDGLAGVQNRVFMVFHPAFGYFASCYDLTMLAIEDEGKEPTPAGMAYLIEAAKEHNIKVVFASPQYSQQSADTIAEEIGGTVVLINPLAEDYVDNLRAVAAAMIQAME